MFHLTENDNGAEVVEHVEVWVREWVRVRRCRHAPSGHKAR